jgi:hypothetical protein
MEETKRFPPAVMLTQLRQKVSRAGVPYLEGRLGLAKCLVLQATKRDEDGNPLWNLCLQEIPKDDTARGAAFSPSIFAPAAESMPIAAHTERKASPKRKEAPEQERVFEFDDNVDDLWGGRA